MSKKSYTPNQAEQALLNRVTVKNIKHFDGGCGHQGCNYTVYLDDKRIATMADDGWGGGAEYTFVTAKAQTLWLKFVESSKAVEFCLKLWTFMDKKDMTADTVMTIFADNAHNVAMETKQRQKAERQIAKRSENAILVGTWDNYHYYTFKTPLSRLAASSNGFAMLKSTYNDALNEAKQGGGAVLNPTSQLQALGLVA